MKLNERDMRFSVERTREGSGRRRGSFTALLGPPGTRGLGSRREQLAAALRRELEPTLDALRTEADIAQAHAAVLANVVRGLETPPR